MNVIAGAFYHWRHKSSQNDSTRGGLGISNNGGSRGLNGGFGGGTAGGGGNSKFQTTTIGSKRTTMIPNPAYGHRISRIPNLTSAGMESELESIDKMDTSDHSDHGRDLETGDKVHDDDRYLDLDIDFDDVSTRSARSGRSKSRLGSGERKSAGLEGGIQIQRTEVVHWDDSHGYGPGVSESEYSPSASSRKSPVYRREESYEMRDFVNGGGGGSKSQPQPQPRQPAASSSSPGGFLTSPTRSHDEKSSYGYAT